MPGEIDLPIPDAGSLARGRYTYFPVVPGRLEFAMEVRAAILRDRPQVIALELPATLESAWMRAVSRLPEISAIVYPDDNKVHIVALSFEAKVTGGELGLSDETTDFGYFSLEEAAQMDIIGNHFGRVRDALLGETAALIK